MSSEENKTLTDLNVRCPSCSRRFQVKGDLMGRMVECGGCDSRFRISEDVLVRSKRVYPGDKRALDIGGFKKVDKPLPITNDAPPAALPDKAGEHFQPSSPLRVLCGFIGVSIILLFIAFVLIASGPGSSLSTMPNASKLLMASFVTVLATVLIISSNPRAWIRATAISLVFSAVAFSVVIFVANATPRASEEKKAAEVIEPEIKGLTLSQRSYLYTLKPLESERAQLASDGSRKTAFGIYITNLRDSNKYTVRDFFIRETGASYSSHLYPRENGNFLMVVSGVDPDLDKIAKVAGKIGEVTGIFPELNTIELKSSESHFMTGSPEMLTNPDGPQFYVLNLKELSSIDLDRARKAVKRLAGTRTELYREDITEALIELLTKPGVKFHGLISQALLEWAENPSKAAIAGLPVLREYLRKEMFPPEELVTLVSTGRQPEAVAVVAQLWESNPMIWDSKLLKFEKAAEPFLLKNLKAEDEVVARSAAKLLSQVGTKKSLSALQAFISSKDPELRILSETAIRNINARDGR